MDASASRKRIVFVIAHLGPGGAQRVATTAANALAARGVEVHVITMLSSPADAYALDPRVQRHGYISTKAAPSVQAELTENAELAVDIEREPASSAAVEKTVNLSWRIIPWKIVQVGRTASMLPVKTLKRSLRKTGSIASFGVQLARRVRWLRRSLRSIAPDAVLSFLTQTNILTVLATRGLPVWTVLSERNDPRRQQHRPRVVLMRKLFYRWSDVVTANSYGALEALQDIVPKKKLAFLPNPLSAGGNGAPVAFAGPTLISVTRLVEQKGVDVLLKAAARAFEVLPEWRLALAGDGPLRKELQALAADLGIAERVDWLGHVADPMPYLRAASVFVLTSRFEGSPNALLEAMACGLPSIVSDASPGPLELVGEEESGLVVPVEDSEATAAAIVRLAKDASLRARLGTAAFERTRVHELDGAMDVWLKLLNCA